MRRKKSDTLSNWLQVINELPPCPRCGVIAGGCLDPQNCPKNVGEELGPYTSCGACGGNGCDRCMPQWFEENEDE